ncbi:hypothetical protein [Luteimonas kalidii]|uniref:Uncharacterized protein n=1 Tax=Luteimonas kalidii TaxID=3042025 RepID=A0ABT6JW87_9GAMM|nr:hypothetical protein [Luteimonas kalidii]MDH5834842.1 hypothetical protein [Luteimonas kalidii]
MPAVSMEDSFGTPTRPTVCAVPRRATTPMRRGPDVLEECVTEFTQRLRACVSLPEDDEHFWARVAADIDALKSRCQPQDAFAFELKAARILAEYGFTAWPEALKSSAHQDSVPEESPAPVPFVVGDAAAPSKRF